MNYNYLWYFYKTAKLGNISKAAIELDVSQPAVSRIISTLEDKCGSKLFTRSKNGVSLTKAGINLFNMIENPFSELERVYKDLHSGKGLLDSTIHFGVTATALSCYLFKHLEEIKREFPNINFKIYTDSSDNLKKMVKIGKIDFALITTPFKEDEEIESHNVHNIEDILIAPISYIDKISTSISIKTLTKFPFILLSEEMQFREHINAFLNENKVKINPTYEADTSNILISFVDNDCGLAFIPSEMAERSRKENKSFKVDLIEKMPNRYIAFIIKKNRNHPKIIEQIKDKIISYK